MNYKIFPIKLGTTKVDRSLYEYRYPVGEIIEMAFGCFLLQGNGKNILVDSGIPTQEEIRRIGFVFGYMDNAPYIMDELKKLGVDPEDVDTIILTHLHWDHSWNLSKFPAAQIYVQKRELSHAIVPNLHERPAYGLTQNVSGCPDWLGNIKRIIPLEGDCMVMDGIKVVTTPGHTPGSQSVLADTKDGQYVMVSDFALTERCFDECVLTGIFTSADDWYASYHKLRQINAKVLTTHGLSAYARKCYG